MGKLLDHSLINGMAKQYPLVGLAMHHHRSLRKTPITWKGRPSLVEFFTDFATLEGGADLLLLGNIRATGSIRGPHFKAEGFHETQVTTRETGHEVSRGNHHRPEATSDGPRTGRGRSRQEACQAQGEEG